MKKILTYLAILVILPYLSFSQWSTDPLENNAIAIATGEEAIPKVATSIYGTSYIAWFSSVGGSYNVRLQKIDVFGNMLWVEDGLLISDHPTNSWLTDWDMTVDEEDCAILTFPDIRNGNNDIFAYRISPDGEFLWGDDGIEMSSSPVFDASPKCCVTNVGNAVFAWQAEDVVILQKISPDGIKLWGDNGITLSGANTYSWPQLLPVGEDDVILKYFEDIGPPNYPTRSVYAQRYDTDGNEVWSNPAIISNAAGISAWTQVFSFINDGTDGFFIAWHDDRDNNSLSSVFVQHIGPDGSILLGDDGTEASTLPGRHNFYPYLSLPVGSPDIFVFWNEMDGNQNNRGIYGQKISSTGERFWGDNGKVFIEISPTNVYPFAASQTDENIILFYENYSTVLNASVFAMMLDTDGEYVWPNQKVELCAVQSEKVHPVAGTYHDGQWIAAWEDSRNGGRDIYAQNVQVDGALGPVEISYELTLSADTLFYTLYGPETQFLTVYNNNPVDVIIQNYSVNFGWLWMESNIYFPYTLNSGDSVALEFWIFDGSELAVTNFDYFQIDIYTEDDTVTCAVAIEEGVVATHSNSVKRLNVFPNPSQNSVSFDLHGSGFLEGEINILNSSGKIVKRIQINGQEQIVWDIRNESGQRVSQGSYYYQIISDKTISSGKLLILE